MVFEVGIEQVVAMVGSGAVLGGMTGYAAKKLLKVAVALVVLEIGILTALEHSGVLNVYWGSFADSVAGASESIGTGILGAVSLVAALPIAGGLTGGFLVGFKAG